MFPIPMQERQPKGNTKMHKKVVCGMLMTCLLSLCFGCVNGNVRTAYNSITYPPTRAKIEQARTKTGMTMLVEVNDCRTEKSFWTYPCAMVVSWIPLIPCFPYKCEDLLLGSPHPLGEEIRHAASVHFESSGLVRRVVKDDEKPDYRMTIKVNYSAEKGCWTLYGGGAYPLGCWFAIFGAPYKYGSNLLDLDVTVCNAVGEKVYSQHFYENVFYCSGMYYNANPLTFLGTGLCNIFNQVTADLSKVMK